MGLLSLNPTSTTSQMNTLPLATRPNGRIVYQSSRDADLPALYEVDEHIQVPNKRPAQRIFVLYQDLRTETVWKAFRKVANWAPPRGPTERVERGFEALDPANDDILYVRDMHGTGKEEDDVLSLWSINKTYYNRDELAELVKLRSDLIGAKEEVKLYKAVKTSNGYEGGIEFERSDQAISIDENGRAYFVTFSYQVQKALLAPSTGNKRQVGTETDHTELNNRLIRIGARASVRGMQKANPHMQEALHNQAELTNLPRIGHDENDGQTSYQLNIAHGTTASSDENLTASLGQFGGTHIDKNDSTTAPTAMTILSQSSDDVETEYFYVMDLGIAVKIKFGDTIFFSGLHFHVGGQPNFKDHVVDPQPYYRLTFIKYPSFSTLDTPSALAFAGLPPKGDVLSLSAEMRDPRLDPLTYKFLNPNWRENPAQRPCTQATSIYDAGALMSRKAYLQHISRGIDQLTAYLVSQAPEEYGLRWDKDTLIASFSILNEDRKRIRAEPWPLGPGWPSTSIHISEEDETEDMPMDPIPVPYDNQPRIEAIGRWAEHVHTTGETIGISILCDHRDPITNKITGASPQRRKGAINKARKEADISQHDDGVPFQDSKGKRKATNIGHGRNTKRRKNNEALVEEMMTDVDVIRQASTLINSFDINHLLKFESILTKPENQILLGSQFVEETQAIAFWDENTDTNLSDIIKVAGELTRIHASLCVGVPAQRLQEAYIQMINMTLWVWLRKFIRSPLPWVEKLHRDISIYLLDTSKEHVLDMRNYVPNITTTSTTTYTIPARQRPSFDIINASAIEDKMQDILSVWLDFPPRAEWECKSWFIEGILDYIGAEGLIIPSISWATTRLNDYVLERGRTAKLTHQNIQDWMATHLSYHPITRSTTLERQSLKRMVQYVLAQYPNWTPVLTCTNSEFRDDFSIVDIRTFIDIQEPLSVDPDQTITIPHTSARGHALKHFLSDVQRNDKKNIFRDLAPSRRHILEDAGPFSQDYLHTRAGFFSALIHRGITHHTEFLLEHKTIFTSIKDWKLTIALKPNKPPKYFCDPCAYGQAAKDRKIENADIYWTFSGKEALTSWLLHPGDQKIQFLDLYYKIRKAHIPAIGALTTYLLVVDYAIAGLVVHPEPLQMGQILFEIKAGGIGGLRTLGFPCRTVQETGEAFEFLMTKLSTYMTPEREERMVFNVFMVEHALCKLSRLGEKHAYTAAKAEWLQGIRL
ncbi:hypothetical protein BDN72DRAFT_903035 [Pluteus cervinus]|uniref:Uncharacterized protein n=1 Tax=Pluteus cervinus TaxID=181527 RepID=A0ACD3A9Y8_9AGAR|nr:hypothetical protein BDN72DRAFT_903035 [Pluteus cervinus]